MQNRKRLGYSAGYVFLSVIGLCAIQGLIFRCNAQGNGNSPSLAVNKAARPRFEVASIRPAPDIDSVMSVMASGKPPHLGTKIDGDRVDMGSMSLMGLFYWAYPVHRGDRVSGPDWMTTQKFDVLAKLPAGATKEQLPEMMQALLEERFNLKFHLTSKLEPGLALIVGPKGVKLEPGIPDPQPSANEKAGASNGGGLGGNSGTFAGKIGNGPYGPQRVSMSDGIFHNEFYNIDAKSLAETFGDRLGRLVVDMTGLEGKYHVVLDYAKSDLLPNAGSLAAPAGDQNPGSSVPADPSLASVYAAIDKLGLKLESRKVTVEQFVIDHIERQPTAN